MTSLEPKADGATRIVAWNCGAGFQNKIGRLIDELRPDVAIVSEACNEGRLRAAGVKGFASMDWIGRYSTRGLGVLTFGSTRGRMYAKDWDQRLEWVLPSRITSSTSFNLLGVWAMNHRAKIDVESGAGRTQGARALDTYGDLLDEPTVIAGDFNNNAIWDKGTERGWRTTMARYEEVGLVSAYHQFFGEHPGEESRATYWWQRNVEQGYHIDYCFVPRTWTIAQVWLGPHESWLRSGDGSDHAPIVVDVFPT